MDQVFEDELKNKRTGSTDASEEDISNDEGKKSENHTGVLKLKLEDEHVVLESKTGKKDNDEGEQKNGWAPFYHGG